MPIVVSVGKMLTVHDVMACKPLTTSPLRGNVFAMVSSPDGKKIYAVFSNDNLAAVIDVETNTVDKYIDVGASPIGIALGREADCLYITTRKDSSIQKLSISEGRVVRTRKVGKQPGQFFIAPDSMIAYVLYSTSNYVGVVDLGEMEEGTDNPEEALTELAHIVTGAPTSMAIGTVAGK